MPMMKKSNKKTSAGDSSQTSAKNNNSNDIWYFGYGPIVNSTVRQRREVQTSCEQAAVLPEHRLTFCFGGTANVVPKRGYDVHGIVMKLHTKEAFNKLLEFDKGGYEPIQLKVYPTTHDDLESNPTGYYENEAITCYVFEMTDYDESMLDKPIEKKPQERYLKLIAQGMREYGIEETYIEDNIMSCPYIPSRPEDQWYKFPSASDPLPKITMTKYEKLCRKNKQVYFILNKSVFCIDDSENNHNPGVEWFRSHSHGKPDITMVLHKLVIDPAVAFCETEEQLTEQHYAWAENHCYEYLQLSGFTAQKVYELTDTNDNDASTSFLSSFKLSKSTRKSRRRSSWSADENAAGAAAAAMVAEEESDNDDNDAPLSFARSLRVSKPSMRKPRRRSSWSANENAAVSAAAAMVTAQEEEESSTSWSSRQVNKEEFSKPTIPKSEPVSSKSLRPQSWSMSTSAKGSLKQKFKSWKQSETIKGSK